MSIGNGENRLHSKKDDSREKQGRQFSRYGQAPRGEGYTRRDDRHSKPIHRQQAEHRESRQELVPKPIGTQCSPSCPLFRCAKRALIIKLVDGKPVAWCTWVNDYCIGYKCQYASCVNRYLLPDGRCLAAIKSSEKSEDEFLKEVEKRDSSDSLKNLLSRRGIRKDLGFEDL